jgi:VCBS repeat-containing protein
VQALRAGETRIETFTYTISDGKGGSSTSTLAITISGTNDAPVGEDDSAATTNTACCVGERAAQRPRSRMPILPSR